MSTTITKTCENVPCLVRYKEAAGRDHIFCRKSLLCFQDQSPLSIRDLLIIPNTRRFPKSQFDMLIKLKNDVLYSARKEFDIPDHANSGVLIKTKK